jgi:cytochrome b involved in lipid metabolism
MRKPDDDAAKSRNRTHTHPLNPTPARPATSTAHKTQQMSTSHMIDAKYMTHGTVLTPDAKTEQKAMHEVKAREDFVRARASKRPAAASVNPQDGDEVPAAASSNPQAEDDKFLTQHATLTKRNPLFHYIHGKPYDLRPFFDKHPGGKDILVMTQGLVDATPLFESYHAFANRPSIMKQLEAYRVAGNDADEQEHANDHGMYAFEEDGFYRTLTRRIRAEFGAEGANADKRTLTKETKANAFWVAKCSTQFALSMAFLYMTFFSQGYSTLQLCGFAVLAGNFFIQWGFTVMHDASHFAIAPRNHWANAFLCRVWCACSLWVCRVWMLHHAVLHHAYTGTSELDPDLYHAVPFVRKHPDTPRSRVFALFGKLGDTFGMAGWAFACTVLYALVPGMWGGQVLQYFAFSFGVLPWKNLWGMTYPDNTAYQMQWYEYLLILAHVGMHLFRANPIVSYAFIVALNVGFFAGHAPRLTLALGADFLRHVHRGRSRHGRRRGAQPRRRGHRPWRGRRGRQQLCVSCARPQPARADAPVRAQTARWTGGNCRCATAATSATTGPGTCLRS